MDDDLTNTIKENATSPASATVDGQTVKQHPLKDQIEVDRHVSSKQAAKRKLGVKMSKVVPPGAV